MIYLLRPKIFFIPNFHQVITRETRLQCQLLRSDVPLNKPLSRVWSKTTVPILNWLNQLFF